MKYKKAQLKMAESLGILIVFFFILIFGFSFYSKIAETQYAGKRQEGLGKKAVDLAYIISLLPEIKCTLGAQEEVIATDVCIDKYKLESAKAVIDDNEAYYYDILTSADVRVKEIYPYATKEWFLYSKIPTDYSRKTTIYVPVSLYDTTAEIKLSISEVRPIYTFGYMNITTYLK